MKLAITKILSVGVLFVAAAAYAERPADIAISTGIGMTTFAPSVTFGMTSQGTSESLRNDLVQVEGDALIALETGLISKELQSVIEKVRLQFPKETKGLQDIEVVEMLYLEL